MCLYPNYVHRATDLTTGEVVTKFIGAKPVELPDDEFAFVKHECFSVPCGKCVECALQYSNEWAYRIYYEAKLHKHNCMLTLTYAQAPSDGNLSKRHAQLFIKRLRKALEPLRIRYFLCGEYGAKFQRPHYHVIIFGWMPSDLEYFFTRDGHSVYKSKFVYDVWCKSPEHSGGYITVEDVTLQSAKYCAKYLQKMVDYPDSVVKPFVCMSLKPGIGLEAVGQSELQTDKLYALGRSISLPRYYVRKAEQRGESTFELHLKRVFRAELLSSQLSRRLASARRYDELIAKGISKKH